MNKLMILVLAAVVAAVSLTGCENNNQVHPTLIVGAPAPDGDFINGFGSGASDSWVKSILHNHCSTYVVSDVGEFVLNTTVVKNIDVSLDSFGNKIYTIEIHDDLKWSNGYPLTATDFVFTVLWYASREWADAGASSTIGSGLLGYTDYHEGTADRFAGVKLIDEYIFSLTIDANKLPFFYETAYAAIFPSYKYGWSYFSEVDSAAEGAKLTSTSSAWTLAFDTRRVAQTERFKPTVTSGPFTFVSYENNAVTLKANPMFKGDYKGQKPQLGHVVIRGINQAYDVDQCIAGEVDAVTGVVEGAKIEAAMNALSVDTAYYPHSGYSGIFFHCDFGPAQHKEVRHAIAYLLDRQQLINFMLDGYGSSVNGMYNQAQWMYLENKDAIDALPDFALDLGKANNLLDQSPYKFEADGTTPFDPAKAAAGDCYRHNSSGERLTINHLETESGYAIDPSTAQLQINAPLAGIDWQVLYADFASMLEHYREGHLQDERKYHSFSLADSFTAVFDPYYDYHSDWQYQSYYNDQHLSDPELDAIMVRMRRLNPEQEDQFSAEWVKFQTRWNQLLPAVPLYTSHYYDVYGKDVKGFRNTPFASWADLVCEITKTQ